MRSITVTLHTSRFNYCHGVCADDGVSYRRTTVRALTIMSATGERRCVYAL